MYSFKILSHFYDKQRKKTKAYSFVFPPASNNRNTRKKKNLDTRMNRHEKRKKKLRHICILMPIDSFLSTLFNINLLPVLVPSALYD